MFAGIKYVCFVVAALSLSCASMPDLANGRIRGVVMVSTPVRDATVIAWRLDRDTGERLEQIASVSTDRLSGAFAFDMGTARGVIELEAIGGTSMELTMQTQITLDRPLRSVLVDVQAGEVRDVALTPFSTVAVALGERRVQAGRAYVEAMRRAYALVGAHLDVDIGRTLAADMRGPVSLDAAGRYGLALAALSALAARIARDSLSSERGYNTLDLMDALLEDAAGPGAVLDGSGPNGPIHTGACVPDPACTTCATVCDLDSNTLRADLGAALVYEFIMTPANATGLDAGDVLAMVDAWRSNPEAELFGTAAIAPITGAPPVVTVGTTTVADESRDVIMFPDPDTAIPVHTTGGQATVLGPGATCETVYKHVTRLDDPLDNPIRWEFSVVGAGIVASAGEFRVGIRDPAGIRWLTGWTPAVQRASVANGYQYEVIVVRSRVAELGTEQGVYEIEFRGRDAFGQIGTAGRCWRHEILPPRLWYSAATTPPATVTRSLHSVNLDPGNNLAPLLNGVPPAQGKVIMEFEIRNGTTEPAYVTFAFDQALASYQKSWRDEYAFLYDDNMLDITCLGDGTCTDIEPPLPQTNDVQGIMINAVSGVVVWDPVAGLYVQPCQGCDPGEYRMEPRLSSLVPRRYRVMLIATDLGDLAPMLPQGDTETGPFEDFTLDPMLPLWLTGRQYNRYEFCLIPDMGRCSLKRVFRHYRALTAATLTIPRLHVTGQASAAPAFPGLPWLDHELSDFVWMTSEPIVPPTSP